MLHYKHKRAYESGALRGKKLLTARRLIEKRRAYGAGLARVSKARGQSKLSSTALVRAFNQEVERQKSLIRKADVVQQRPTFVGAAMARMLSDDNFINLLRAEGLETLPKSLENKVRETGAPYERPAESLRGQAERDRARPASAHESPAGDRRRNTKQIVASNSMAHLTEHAEVLRDITSGATYQIHLDAPR